MPWLRELRTPKKKEYVTKKTFTASATFLALEFEAYIGKKEAKI